MGQGSIVWFVQVPSDLDKEFRSVITKAHDGKIKRGFLKDSLIEAVEDWIKKQNTIQLLREK